MNVKIKKSGYVFLSVLISLLWLTVITPQKAFAAVKTWDGGGADNNWSTAANWNGDTVPVNGDSLVFDITTAASYGEAMSNDLTNLSISGLSLTGAGTSNKGFKVTGNDLTLTGDITSTAASGEMQFDINVTLGANVQYLSGQINFGDASSSKLFDLGTNTLTIDLGSNDCIDNIASFSSSLKGSGNITITDGYVSFYKAKNTYTGSVTVNGGAFAIETDALGTGNTITVNGTASLTLIADQDATFTPNIVMNSSANPSLQANYYGFGCAGGGGPAKSTTTLSGNLTLNANTIFSGYNDLKVTGTYTANGKTLSVKSGSPGSITTSAGTISTEKVTTTINADDKSTASVAIGNGQTYVINGERGSISVGVGGVLKGTGKVADVYVFEGGTVAPGTSPGCLSSSNVAYEADGIFEAEINNATECTGYDRLNVTGTVTITDAVLSVKRLSSYKPIVGTKFLIVSNDSTDAVTGTFKGLAQGANLTVDGVVYLVSYTGGDGNDIELTAIGGPNTGFERYIMSNPALVLFATVITAGAIYFIGKNRTAFSRNQD